jgi:dihydroxyacetone kinase-like protein
MRSPTAVDLATATPAAVDAATLRSGFRRARRSIDRHAAALTRLDAVLGDGDHGDNLAIGFRAVDQLLDELPETTPPGDVLKAIGYRLVGAVGGASGPLYGTACIEAGFRAGTAERLDATLLAAMLDAAADALARRGRCAIGDKTMFDTLRPAADAFAAAVRAGADLEVAWRQALVAGRAGMRATRPLVARRGLALRLGPRSAGHLDPGAVSCYVLLASIGGR